jgi:transcriptional regulator with XRE-family HTH domain
MESNLPQSIGTQLKRRRLELHLFQADLAKRLGVSAVSVSNWERGAIQPSRRIRARIREFLTCGLGAATEKRTRTR